MSDLANITADEDKILADICKGDFYEFLQEFWTELIDEVPVYNWHIPYLCKGLQVVAERVFKGEPKKYDVAINISPGTTKTTICSVMYPAWIWTRMPSARIISCSYSHLVAVDSAVKSRQIIESEKYKRLFPNVELSEVQNAKDHYRSTKNGMRYSAGTRGRVTGQHGHFIIIDDPINPLEASSKVGLKTANAWIGKTLLSRKVDKAVTPTIMIMQRLHQEDPTNFFLSREGAKVKHVCLPARQPKDNDKRVAIKPASLAERYIDGLMDPVRLSDAALAEARSDLGEYGYASQFDQTPIPEGGGMFETNKFKMVKMPLRPDEYRIIVRFWDKAASSQDGDFSAGAKMAVDKHGSYWVLHVAKGQWGTFLRESRMKLYASQDGYDVWIGLEQEPGSGGKDSTLSSIKNLAGYITRVCKPTGDKVLRADAYSIQVNAGNVYMVEGSWNAEYKEELSFFPHAKHDDQVDASSGAFSILSKGKTRVGGIQ